MDDIESMLKKYSDMQSEFMKQMNAMQMNALNNFIAMLQALTQNNAIFKATVQSNGRITIPEAEREALRINEGDLVQVIIIPLIRRKKD